MNVAILRARPAGKTSCQDGTDMTTAGEKCVRRTQWRVWNSVSWKGKNPLVIPGMGKVCNWLEEDWGLEDSCMRPNRVLDHEVSWGQWFIAAPFFGNSLQDSQKEKQNTVVPGNTSEIMCMYVLCQKSTQPSSCEEEEGQHYILMTCPCISESRAHLASRGCLSLRIMLFKLAGVLLCRGLYLLKQS